MNLSLDDEMSAIIHNTPVTAQPLSTRNLELFLSWKESCENGTEGHENCVNMISNIARLPTRVIAVGNLEQDPRLHCSQEAEMGQYATLSYCWGGPQPHQTTIARLSDYKRSLPLNMMPATIIHAIILARALRIAYLWVDSICIIQDSDEDKSQEIAMMASIYKNSILTFSAARAESCYEGFLNVQDLTAARLSSSFTLPMNSLQGTIGKATVYPHRFSLTRSSRRNEIPIDERAWTYQELLLSPRKISFHVDGVEWECPSLCEGDDGLLEKEHSAFGDSLSNTKPLQDWLLYHMRSSTPISENNLILLPITWWMVIREYTMRRLSFVDDKLLAISSIATEFQRLRPDEYLAGMWRSTLLRDLQWQRGIGSWSQLMESALIEKQSTSTEADSRHRVPTWSWASVDGPVTGPWENLKSMRESRRAAVISCDTNLVSEAAPFGLVSGGKLVIRGPLKSLSIDDTYDRFMETSPYIASGALGTKIGIIQQDHGNLPNPPYRTSVMDFFGEHPSTRQEYLGVPPHETTIWFLGLASTETDEREISGLVLWKNGDGTFSRTGHFRLRHDPFYGTPTTAAQLYYDHWGNDYVITTITIV
jgi:hypothetical protein